MGVLALAAFVVNALGALAQERCGGRGFCFPDWLYTASGIAFVPLALGIVIVTVVGVSRRVRRS